MDWILWVLGILAVLWVIGSASRAGKGTDRKAEPRKPKAKLAEQEEHSKPTPERRVGYKVDQNINAANMTTIWAGDCPHIEFTSNGNRFSAMPEEVLHNPEDGKLYLRAYFPHEQETHIFRLSSLETKILMRSKRYTQEEWLRKVIGDELYNSVVQDC